MFQSLLLLCFTLFSSPYLLVRAKMRRKHTQKPRRILVIQLSKIGDLICTTPLFRALADAGDEVTVLCLGTPAQMLENNPSVKQIIVSSDTKYNGLWGRIHLLLGLHREKFDVSISVFPGYLYALLSMWTAAPIRICTRKKGMGFIASILHCFCSHSQTYVRGTRTYEHYMAIAQTLGAEKVSYKHEVFLSQDEKEWAKTWRKNNNINSSPYAVLSVTAGNQIKEWPRTRFAALADHLLLQWKLHVVISSSDVEATKEVCSLSQHRDKLIDAGGLPLRELSAIIAESSLFVSVDTGPLYIAHAFDVPLVDIVGPVDPREQPPTPGDRVSLILPLGVQPSTFVAETLRVSTKEQRLALECSTVEIVVQAVDTLLKKVSLHVH